jgi:hypothetical protein
MAVMRIADDGHLPPAHAATLAVLCDRLPVDEVNWALTGSTALLLQGVPVGEPHDIDIQTDQHDWAEVEHRLAEFVIRPVRQSHTSRIRSHFGALLIHGVQVEIMGGVQHPDGEGWTSPVDPRDHQVLLDWRGRVVPVLRLTYEAAAYNSLGRRERVRLIRDWIARSH